MKLKYLFLLLAVSLFAFSCDPVEEDVEKPDITEPVDKPVFRKRRIEEGTISVSVRIIGSATGSNAGLSVVLPCPCDNEYQEITDVETTGDVKEGEDGSFRYVVWNDTFTQGDKIDSIYRVSFKMASYTIEVDFSQIKEIHPYDTASLLWKKYTGCSGEYIDPYDETIERLADNLWQQTGDIVKYARQCYRYVAEHYKYLNPNTGIHTLKRNLSAGGGDCGNLSAIYISLLRNKGIPARPVVAVRTDGTFHVWSEFYLESYGWVPVDVTYLNSDPRGNYFGVYPADCVVMSNEYDLLLDIGESPERVTILQTYVYWYRGISGLDAHYSAVKSY